jgi:nucleotide-binding universal stress UspA family protein
LCPAGEVIDSGDLESEFKQAEKTIQDVLEEANGRFAEAGLDRDRVTTKVVTGAPSRAKAIVVEAKAGGYGTIVVGRRGLSRVEEFFMGRISSKVIQLAKEMAVWVVS